MRIVWSVLLAVAVVTTGNAAAGPIPRNLLDADYKAWFYNRPGATANELESELSDCQVFASPPPDSRPGGFYGAGGDLLGMLLMPGKIRALVDDCMISKGFRRFEVPDKNLKAFESRYARMSQDAKAALSGSDSPPDGKLAREWVNSYWSSTDAEAATFAGTRIVRPVWTILPKSPVKLEELAPIAVGKPIQPGPDEAVVVFTVRREGEGKKRAGFNFYRYDPLTGQRAPAPVGKKKQVRQINFGADSYRPKTAGAQSEPRTYIFILPAGTYGLNYLGIERDINYMTELCMGTVAFTAEPGAVLHLGDWSIEIGDKKVSDNAPPSPLRLRIEEGKLGEMRAQLAGQPEIAEKLVQARFKSGFVKACANFSREFPVYGVDLPPGSPLLESAPPAVVQ